MTKTTVEFHNEQLTDLGDIISQRRSSYTSELESKNTLLTELLSKRENINQAIDQREIEIAELEDKIAKLDDVTSSYTVPE